MANTATDSEYDSRTNLEIAAQLLGLPVTELSRRLRAASPSANNSDHRIVNHVRGQDTLNDSLIVTPSFSVLPSDRLLLASAPNDTYPVPHLLCHADQAPISNEPRPRYNQQWHQQQQEEVLSGLGVSPIAYPLENNIVDWAPSIREASGLTTGSISSNQYEPQRKHDQYTPQRRSNALDSTSDQNLDWQSINKHAENYLLTSTNNLDTVCIARAAPAPSTAALNSLNNLQDPNKGLRDVFRRRKRSFKEHNGHTEQMKEAESSASRSAIGVNQTAPQKRQRRRRSNRSDQHNLVNDVNGSVASRAPFNDTDRAETAKTREMHACIRCQLGRNRCKMDPLNPSGPCLDCQKVTRSLTSRLPCLRYLITDASLYREQDMPFQMFSKRWKSMDMLNIDDWASSDIRTIELTQVFLNVPYQVQVREFCPKDGDMIEEIWHDGGQRYTHQIPRYALVDMEHTADMFDSWIEKNVVAYINGTVGDRDELIFQTYRQAVKHIKAAQTVEERILITNTLKLWVACRKTSHPERICGDDTLGARRCDHPQSPWYQHIPMPPIMIAQFECIMYTRFLRPLSSAILKSLKHLVGAQKKKYWLTIYLTMFMLLHSCSMIARRDAEYALQINAPTKYANPYAIMGHQAGARMLLAHFHHVNKGEMPFHNLSRASAQRSFQVEAELGDDQVEFVQWTALMVAQKAGEMKYVQHRGNYTHELYWVSQLYNTDWKPLHLE